jgi:hypothetical protein
MLNAWTAVAVGVSVTVLAQPAVAPNDTPAVRERARGAWLVGGDAASLVVAMDDRVFELHCASGCGPELSGLRGALR